MATQLAKVRIKLDPSDWRVHGSETLWAAPVAGQPLMFRLANSPFSAKGVNRNDTVEATPTEDKAIFDFDRIAKRNGHSTYMILTETDGPRLRPYWDALERKGCSYESAHVDLGIGRRLLLSVDVPPSSNLREVYDLPERGEVDRVWLFQEGHAYSPGQ